jgi:hypothetical protein
MSHIVTINIQMRELEAIKRACARLGWTFKENQKTYNWFGDWVDDSPVPRGLFASEQEYQAVLAMDRTERKQHMNNVLGKCEHAISVPGCQYEIGLIKHGSGYTPIWDWYEIDLHNALGSNADPLKQAYAVERAKIEAQRSGYRVHEKLLPSGAVHLTIQGY